MRTVLSLFLDKGSYLQVITILNLLLEFQNVIVLICNFVAAWSELGTVPGVEAMKPGKMEENVQSGEQQEEKEGRG